MSSESNFTLTGKAGPANSILVTLRGDNFAELATNAATVGISEDLLLGLYAQAYGVDAGAQMAQAVQTVQTAFPQAAVVPQSVVGAPGLPQPGVALPGPQAPAAAPVGAPPTSADPGPCQHGVRQFKSSNTARGQWNRWECPIPYSRENAAFRCKAINA